MAYTLGAAAKATGKSKAAVLQAIRTGRISAVKNELGNWAIEPVELHRVYTPVRIAEPDVTRAPERDQTPTLTVETGMLRERLAVAIREIALLTAMLDRERREVEDLRERLTEESAERRRLTLAITDQRQRRRWWGWRWP